MIFESIYDSDIQNLIHLDSGTGDVFARNKTEIVQEATTEQCFIPVSKTGMKHCSVVRVR